MNEWRLVVHLSDCLNVDEDSATCPVCAIDYGDCDCPGPTQDGMEYTEINGELYAREIE